MKKILMGLLAVSAVSFAAATPPTLTNGTENHSPIFNQKQEGMLPVEGSITSTVPEIKFVVYAATDGGADPSTGDTKVVLPKFKVSANPLEAGFESSPALPKVYVKKVTGSTTVSAVDAGTTVEFRVGLDSSYSTGVGEESGFSGWFSAEVKRMRPFALVPRGTINGLFSSISDKYSGIGVNEWGNLQYETSSTFYVYMPGKDIGFEAQDGVLTISAVEPKGLPSASIRVVEMTEQMVNDVNGCLVGDIQSAGVNIYARVK